MSRTRFKFAFGLLNAWVLVALLSACGSTPTAAPTTPAATTAAETTAPTAEPATTPDTAASPAGQKILTVAIASQYGETLDVFQTSTTMEAHNMIYETLVSVDQSYAYQPGLATSWETSEDGLTWTFKLREGVTFHDGTPFDAEVVKWWLEQMKTGVNAYMFETMTEATVVDPQTIAMTFSAPFPNLLYNLSTSFSGIMSKAAYEQYGAEYGTKYAVGTGPFMLKEWVPNERIVLAKNPAYNWAPEWTGHSGPANVDGVVFRFLPEDATRVVEFQTGNVQLMLSPPPARELAQFQNNPDYFVLTSPGSTIQFIGMHVQDPLLADLRTRQAIGFALDRSLIFDTIYQQIGAPTTIYLAQELGANGGIAEIAPGYDLERARALLAEVGWKAGPDGILVAETVEGVPAGTPFEVSYLTYQEDEFRRMAEVTQNMLAEVGIKANIQQLDNPSYTAKLKEGGVQLILRQYEWDNNDILEWFLHSKNLSYPNYLGLADEQLDAMLDDANYQTATWEERDVKYTALHKYLIETLYPWAPIRQSASVYVGRSNVQNFMPIPLRGTSSTELWTMVDLSE